MKNALQWAAIGLLLVTVAGCGGGGGGDDSSGTPTAPPTPASTNGSDYVPLAADGRYVYVVQGIGIYAVDVASVTGTQTIDGQSATVVETADPHDGGSPATAYFAAADGIHAVALGGDALTRAVGSRLIVPQVLHPGDLYTAVALTGADLGIDHDDDGRTDRYDVTVQTTVVGFEPLNTPAGIFTDVLHLQSSVAVDVTRSSDGEKVPNVRVLEDTWYAAGVGLLRRSVVTDQPPSSTQVVSTLQSYRVAGAQSDVVRPTIQSVVPDTPNLQTRSVQPTAVFSEPIDPATVTAGVFSLLDPNGAAVDGRVGFGVAGATFVPAHDLPSGTYRARVTTGVADYWGNHLAAERTWTFTVDATSPSVTGTSPGQGAVDVPLDATLTVTFDELPQPQTLTVVLTKKVPYDVTVPVETSVTGNVLTVRPQQALVPGVAYTLSVGGQDKLGNSSLYSLNFQASQGAFSDPRTPLPLAGSGSVAIADIDGDGVGDLLVAGALQESLDAALYVVAGRRDGTLAAPIRLADLPDNCGTPTIAVADFDGDGRLDIAVGSCDVRVFHRQPDGSYTVSETFAQTVTQLRAADLDGDGRAELVGSGDTRMLTVWRSGADGVLAFAGSVPVASTDARIADLQIADVDGDGRSDFVAAVAGDPAAGAGVHVTLQQPGGGYAAPSRLDIGSTAFTSSLAIAIGDFNGDGRTDIAAADGTTYQATLAVWYQLSNGTFGTALRVQTRDAAYVPRAADMDGDGRADLVVGHGSINPGVGVYLQRADGTLSTEVFYAAAPVSDPSQLAIGDLNADGRRDIAAGRTVLLRLAPPITPSAAPRSTQLRR